jgi:hypothetical protein
MDTTTSVAATTVVVIAGRWAQDKPITVNVAVGAGVLAISLAILDNVNAPLAQKFSLAVLITALFVYAVPLATKTGYGGNSVKGQVKGGRVQR